MTSAAEIVAASAIGASEIPGIVKISPWLTPWIVYARKMGLLDPEPETPEMKWGTRLQTVIAQAFADETGLEVEWSDRRIYSRDLPWQSATPDAFIVTGRRRILEVKTAGVFAAGEWSRDVSDARGVPDYYNAQVQWQLDVTGLESACIAVLIGGSDFRIYWIEGDPVIQDYLREEGETFWFKHIVTGVAPPMGDTEAVREYLKRRWPRNTEKLRPATVHEASLLDQYTAARGIADVADAAKNEIENELKNAIGDSEGLLWRGGKLTWKKAKDSEETDWEQLAMDRLGTFTPEDRQKIISRYKRIVPGSRRIRFTPVKEAA